MYCGEKVDLDYQQQYSLPVCFGCLSSNRRLYQLDENTSIFWKLFDNLYSSHQSPVLLCWECTAVLRRVKLFKDKVDHAQVLLGFYYLNQENTLPHNLSNLSVQIIHNYTLAEPLGTASDWDEFQELKVDPQYNTSNAHFEIVQVQVKLESYSDNDEQDTFLDSEPLVMETETKTDLPDIQTTNIETIQTPESEIKTDLLIETNYVNKSDSNCSNNGHSSLKEENSKTKKLKFKWVDSKVSIQKMKAAKKIYASLNEIADWMERDRNSDYFKKLASKCERCVCGISPEKMEDHESSHIKTTTRNIVCELCELTFLSKKNLSNHINKLHRHLLECSVCGFKCYSREYMLSHLAGHKRNVQCRTCKNYFLSKHAFYLHYRTIHCKYVCDDCGKRCESKNSIRKHIRAKHLPYICKPCNRSYTTYYNYIKHVDIKHKLLIPEEVYCVPCDKRFSNPGSYRWHLKNSQAHADERPAKPPKDKEKDRVRCPECNNTYANSAYMKMHYQYMHQRDSKFRCKYCGKQLVCKSRLNDHIKTVHEGVKPVKNKFCTVCGRGFSSNAILTNHMRTHTGERPYQCPHCDARFSQRAAMRTHIKGVHLKARRL